MAHRFMRLGPDPEDKPTRPVTRAMLLRVGEIMRGGNGGFLFVALHQPPQGIFSRDGDVTRDIGGALGTTQAGEAILRRLG